MDIANILDYVIKWAVPFICAGLFTIAVKPLFSTFLAGYRNNEQVQWDRHAEKLINRIDELETNNRLADAELTKQIDGVARRQDKRMDELNKKQDELSDDIANIAAGTRHILLHDIVEDGAKYVNAKSIAPLQLAEYQERYQLYKKLHGDGYADSWMAKVDRVEVREPLK